MRKSAFIRSRQVSRAATPPSGAPQSLLAGGDLSRAIEEAPQLSQMGAVAPVLANQSQAGAPHLLRAPIQRVLDSIRYSDMVQKLISIGTVSEIVLERPSLIRNYLMIVNTHPTQTLYVSFGAPASTFHLPLPPFVSPAVGGFIEYIGTFVPQNDVHIVASGGATSGLVLYSENSIAQLGV